MLLEFLGADHEVTGSCHFMKIGDKHILVDCGMEQGADLYVNQDIPVNASDVDYVLITHAHIDHSGLLPLLYNHGFRGQIYATVATCQLCNIMLKDSAHIQMFEAEWKNRKARRAGQEEVIPLYDMNDAEGVLEHFVECSYNEIVNVCPEMDIRFIDAGHLLGSASIEVWAHEDDLERKIVFSGDIGNVQKPLVKDPHFISEADYVVMESTYGNRDHQAPPDYAKELAEVLKDTFKRGGNLVIPAFSVGRTQEMLYFFRKIKMEHMIPEFENFDVYVDSPLAIEATNIFNKNVEECFDDEAMSLVKQGINPIGFEGLKLSITSDESKMINFIEKPVVIISASGMCEAGRIRHHLKHNLWRSESTILFVGYQVPGTLGNMLLNGASEVKLFGEVIDVRAKILNLAGISGHADRSHLLDWVSHFEKKPKHVFVVHGEDSICEEFAESVRKEFGITTDAPYSGDVYDLETNLCIQQGSRQKVEKQETTKAGKVVSGIFARLVAAGQRLASVIQKCYGMPNKELAKFADQINSLCDKWEK